MKKLAAFLAFLVCFAATVDFGCADGFGGAGFIQLTVPQRAASPPSPVPTLVAGSFAPKGQTPAMPSVSTEPVRCGPQVDNSGASIWGTGCNATTGFCTTPTTSAPYQPCQPPQMLVTTGGTGNGTTGQILYTSYASATYPAGEAIIVGDQAGNHLATQANWNTPHSHANGFATSASNALCPTSGPSVTLTLNDSASANPYAITGPNSTVYINGVTGSVAGQYQSFGWTAGNPNGSYSLVAVGGSTGAWTITYCTGVQVTGTYLLNSDSYSGIVTSPYIALAGSNCGIGGNPFACQVSFLNSHSCASSCVSANTQFIAGQFDDLIINHHFGEQVPLSQQNGVVEPCAITSHISGTSAAPAFSAYAELDGGTFVKTTPITDPRGTGASGLSAPAKKVFCVQFNAGSVADGEHEVSWIACPIVGFCGRLSSTQAIDAASSSSTFFKSNNHALQGGTILGIVASPDTQFPVFDWTQSTLRNLNGTAGSINATSISMATGFVTYNFTALPIVNQFQPHSTVGINGLVAGNSCTVTGGTSTGAVLTLNLTGTCVFPTNSTVNIAGVVITGGNAFAWNGTIVKVSSGGTCAAGACSIQIPSLSTAAYASGGSVTANLNGQCVISSSTTTSITCPTLADTSTTRVSGGNITSTANLFCAPGGNGDVPAPYDPAGGVEVKQFFPDSYQLVPYIASPVTCSNLGGQTGCFGPNCGRLPSQQETLWVTRFEAGIDEREVTNSNTPKLETGSLFVWTNAGATIKNKNVWVDSWNSSAVKTGCYSSATPCGDLSHALYALQATSAITNSATGNQTLANLTGTAGSCLVFKNAGNVSGAIPLYDGEPEEFVAYDGNAGAQLSQFGLYWIVGVGATETGDANGVVLAATRGGPCINDTASGIFGGLSSVVATAWIVNDLGFDNVYLACNTTLTSPQVPCSHTHPETYDWKVVTSAAATAPLYARSGYLNIGPDTTNGVTHDEVSALNGTGLIFANVSFAAQGGRIHKTADSTDKELSLTPAVALGPTLPITTVTGGSLATCPAPFAAHQCEILTFAAHKNPATQANDGSTFQAPTATNPDGQAVIVSGIVSSASSSCGVTSASSISGVSFTLNFTTGAGCTAFTASNAVNISGISLANTCAVTSATSVPGVSFTLNFTPGAGCTSFSTSYPVNISGVVVSGGNAVAWNGNGLTPTLVTSSSVTLATTSTASYVSGGSIAAGGNQVSWNGNNLNVTSATASSITVATTSTSGYFSGGTIAANWNCGTTIASSCGFGGTNGLSSAVVASTATSVSFINDNAVPASTWVSGGKITPVDLVVELAPGTLTTTACATDGIPNDTHASLTCVGSNSVTAGAPQWLGTNSTSFPLSLNGTTFTGTNSSISRNSNCLYVVHTGEATTTVGSQAIEAIIPATGGNNDVMLLAYSNALTIPYYAYNQCDTLWLQNSVFSPIGAVTDMWYDSETISGPTPYSDLTGSAGSPNTDGAYYSTNGTRQSTIHAFDAATYAWGGHAQYNATDCMNASFEQISNTCNQNGQTVIPFALGGSLNTDGTQWTPILGSLDSAGAPVLCSGAPCVTTASRSFQIAQSTIPYFTTPVWSAFVVCNMPAAKLPLATPLSTNAALIGNTLSVTYINNDSNPALVTVATGPTGASCLVSANPAIVWSNNDHIDYDFNTFGPGLLPSSTARGAWQTYNSVIQENVSGTMMGPMEGWAYQGGSVFNFALEDMYMGLSQEPVPNDFPFVTIGQAEARNQYNLILRNDFFGTYVSGSAAIATGYASQWADIYFINDSGGTAQTNFPGVGLLDWTQTSFWNATSDIFQPVAGEAALGGMATNYSVWPTGTRSVDPATGLPNGTPSASFYNSMTAAPWDGILGDTGQGTQ